MSEMKAGKPTLYHFTLDPFCRRVRLALGEYNAGHTLEEILPWRDAERLPPLQPAPELPVFVDDDDTIVVGIYAVTEYLEETRPGTGGLLSLLGSSPAERAEVRRLVSFFDGRFYMEVSGVVLMEKALRRLLPKELGGGAPDTSRLRQATARLPEYLLLIERLTENSGLLAGENLSLADLAAAAHLSVLEYLDTLRFDGFENAKVWYQRIKSRPSFRPLLSDRVAGIMPPSVYAALDF